MLATLNLPELTISKAHIVDSGSGLHRVVIGPYTDLQTAEQDLERLHDFGMEALLKYF